MRAPNLNRWYRKAGFKVTGIKSFPAERIPPLWPIEIEYLKDIAPTFAQLAQGLDLSEEDLAQWRKLLDPEATEYILNHPDFYWREAHIMLKGRKPAE